MSSSSRSRTNLVRARQRFTRVADVRALVAADVEEDKLPIRVKGWRTKLGSYCKTKRHLLTLVCALILGQPLGFCSLCARVKIAGEG